jgi:hypothetical protein
MKVLKSWCSNSTLILFVYNFTVTTIDAQLGQLQREANTQVSNIEPGYCIDSSYIKKSHTQRLWKLLAMIKSSYSSILLVFKQDISAPAADELEAPLHDRMGMPISMQFKRATANNQF